MTRAIARGIPTRMALVGALALLPLAACESLPGDRREQATAVGGAGGAAVGAAVSENRLLGALLGGALGAGAGYLLGAETDWLDGDSDATRAEAESAIAEARADPAAPSDVEGSETADLDGNGFVTMDEVVAMEEAGLSDEAMLTRLEATGQVFELEPYQEESLREEGVSADVIAQMQELNADERDRVLSESA